MNPSEFSELVNALHDGDENAFHTLLEADHTILPNLMQHFAAEADGAHRARILEVIWQHRLTSTIPFLASALHDPHSEVWKQALDGLVAIGGNDSRNVLVDFRSDIAPNDDRFDWVNEAIDQIQT